jgi:hypothetical protein
MLADILFQLREYVDTYPLTLKIGEDPRTHYLLNVPSVTILEGEGNSDMYDFTVNSRISAVSEIRGRTLDDITIYQCGNVQEMVQATRLLAEELLGKSTTEYFLDGFVNDSLGNIRFSLRFRAPIKDIELEKRAFEEKFGYPSQSMTYPGLNIPDRTRPGTP